MRDDPLDRLRRANPYPRPLPAPPAERIVGHLTSADGSAPAARDVRPFHSSRAFSAIPVGAALVTAVVVAGVALVLIGHGRSGPPGPLSAAPDALGSLPPVAPLSPGNKHLLTYFTRAEVFVREHRKGCGQIEPVLIGRPSNGAGSQPSPAILATFGVLALRQTHPAAGAIPGGRYARVAQRRYGYTFVVATNDEGVPSVEGLTTHCQQLAFITLNKLLDKAPRATRRLAVQLAQDQLRDQQYLQHHPANVCLFSAGAGSCVPVLFAQARGSLQSASDGRHGSIFAYLVPNGVAQIEAHFAPEGRRTGFTHHIAATTATARVINNVAVFRLRHEPPDVSPYEIIWRSSNGTIIKVAYQ